MKFKEWHSEAVKIYEELKLNGRKISCRELAQMLGKGKSQVADVLRYYLGDGYSIDMPASEPVKPPKQRAKVVVLDIETSKMMFDGFSLFNNYFGLDNIAEDWHVLSVSYKWLGEEEVFYYDVAEHDEMFILQKLYDVLNEADFLIAHNGRRFDLKKIRARLIINGFKPHSPVRVIDTLEITKKEFAFTSNKLAYLTGVLCKRYKKSSHDKFHGIVLWQEFAKGNIEAINEMREYNQLDVLSLEELYFILAPWAMLPNFDVYTDELLDMSEWEEDGFVFSNLGKYTRYRHKTTGAYRRGRVNLLSKEKRSQIFANIV